MSTRKSLRSRKPPVEVYTPEDLTLKSRTKLRPRKQTNYKVESDSFSGSIGDVDDNSQDKDYTEKTGTDSDSDSNSSSGSELFSKKTKKRKLNSTRIDSSICHVFETIDPTEEENEYRRQRQKNMQDRFKILGELEFDKDIEELKAVVTPIRKPEKPVKRPKPVKPSEPEIRRSSLRLLNRSLNVTLTDIAPKLQFGTLIVGSETEDRRSSRITNEIVPFVEEDDETWSEVLQTLKDDVNLSYEETCDFISGDYNHYCEVIKSCSLNYEPYKIIKDRIVSMDFHPSAKKLLLLAGDKRGNIAIQDIVDHNTGIQFKPHAYNVNCVSFSTQDHSKFYSTSLEGVSRQGDINSSTTTMVYEARHNEHTTWHHESGHSLFVAEGDGVVKVVDLRTPGSKCVGLKCHTKSVRTVQVHPTNDNYFLTGSGHGEFCIFDIRSCNSDEPNPVVLEYFPKALTSAFFSAKGNYVVSTCNDDTIRTYDVSDLKTSKELCRIGHNNHTGRWLSVFKARWQPGREDAFLVGSMMQPQRMQVYHRSGKEIHNFMSSSMKTYSPVIAAHPSEPIFVGGSGSGRIHVFSPFKSLEEIYV